MKKLITLTLLLFTRIVLAQADYFTDCFRPAGLAVKNNLLYFVEDGSIEPNKGKMSSIDLTQTTPVKTTILNNLSGPRDIVIDGNDMYLIELSGSLYKINLTEPDPSPTFLQNVTGNLTTNDRALDLTLHNGYLYTALLDQGKIIRIPISSPSTFEVMFTGLEFPDSTALIGNELYFTDFINGNGFRLYKINITETNPMLTVVESKLEFGNDIAALGTDIYTIHGGSGNSNVAKRISATDTTANLPTFDETILRGIDANSTNFIILGDDVYISTHQIINSRIQKYKLDNVLSLDKTTINHINIYPNPLISETTISAKENISSISVYNSVGNQIEKHVNLAKKTFTLNMTNYPNGIYLVKVVAKNKTSLRKIIKN